MAIIDSNTGAWRSGNYGANQAGAVVGSFEGQADRIVVVAVAPGTQLGGGWATVLEELGADVRPGFVPPPAGARSETPMDQGPGSSTRTASRPRATGG